MSIYKLENVIKNYAWGSKTAITELFSIANPNSESQAEIWMGAHPNGCSKLIESGQLLSELIAQDKVAILGGYTALRFGELPFLFKVLAAQTPLSIQVHPNKQKAEAGFARENAQGIELEAANRNYKDPNHKPELVYALTRYKAMNGFRPIEQIVALFKEAGISVLYNEINALEASPNSQGLRAFFCAIMSIKGERKESALAELYAAYEKTAKSPLAKEALGYSASFRAYYEGDIGLFSPLFLNTIELSPGEAMFLQAETPHAYVEGTGLEVMANSDNVLRAGLTPKYMDLAELIDNTLFEPTPPSSIKLSAINKGTKQSYPVPVDDFGFDICIATQTAETQFVRGAEIVFCVDGEVTISAGSEGEKQLTLIAGESAFIASAAKCYQFYGIGRLARAYN